MSELDYISANELVFNNDTNLGIHSGGFSVNSIMLKSNMSPIMTMNSKDSIIGGGNKVSDLFNDLVIPNWALSYNNRIIGGKYKEPQHNSDSEEDVVDDDLHEKLLELVKEDNIKSEDNVKSKDNIKSKENIKSQDNIKSKENKKKLTRRIKKTLPKKGITKRNK